MKSYVDLDFVVSCLMAEDATIEEAVERIKKHAFKATESIIRTPWQVGQKVFTVVRQNSCFRCAKHCFDREICTRVESDTDLCIVDGTIVEVTFKADYTLDVTAVFPANEKEGYEVWEQTFHENDCDKWVFTDRSAAIELFEQLRTGTKSMKSRPWWLV